MNFSLCINSLKSSPHLMFPQGESLLKTLADKISALPNVTDIKILASDSEDLPAGFQKISPKEETAAGLVEALIEASGSANHIIYFFADTPFIDPTLTKKMMDNHLQYYAEYSFADCYPEGMAPEILDTSILPRMKTLAQDLKGGIERDSLFSLIQKDINSFDIETEICDRDYRPLRLKLNLESRGNALLCERIASSNPQNRESLLERIDSNPLWLRTLPAYYSIQITEKCPQCCLHCPYPLLGDPRQKSKTMPFSTWKSIINKISSFTPEAYISLSPWGEPALHREIEAFSQYLLDKSRLKLIFETSGIGWQEESLKKILERGESRIDWIVSLDAIDPELYKTFRGEGQKEALQFIETLHKEAPDSLWIQAVRMVETEEHLDTLYRYWQERGYQTIIQKYDSFSQKLPQRRVTDLSPIKRNPCWHIKRDMTILVDGTVPLCRDDIEKTVTLGNINNSSFEEIWAKGEASYQDHLKESYSPLCLKCDEYYTFNF